MPDEVKSVVGSFPGTIGADGIIVWPRFWKKARYRLRTSETVILVEDITTGILSAIWLLPAFHFLGAIPRFDLRMISSCTQTADG